jgi:hypothetical protein
MDVLSFMVGIGLNFDPVDGASDDLTGDVHDFEVVQFATCSFLNCLLECHNHVSFFLLSGPCR